MKRENLKILSNLRMERAKEFLREAELFLKNKMYRGAVNRSYYAVFTAMRSLLVLEGGSPKTYEGTKILFNLRFIRTKKLSEKIMKNIEDLYRARFDADYSDFVSIEKNEAGKLFKVAKMVIQKIEKLQKRLIKE
jgi:hypothetical protein